MSLTAVGIGLSVVKTFMSYKAQKAAGKQEQIRQDAIADQRERDAKVNSAVGQRQALEKKRPYKLAASAVEARAAASGGGTSDPTVTNIIADIEGKGQESFLNHLWSVEERSDNLRYGAEMARWEGRVAKKSANHAAMGTLIGGLASAGMGMAKYGMGDAPGMDTYGMAGSGGASSSYFPQTNTWVDWRT